MADKTDATADVLGTLDEARFQWYHVKAILISGVGFFTDAYDLFCVGIITPMIAFARWPIYPDNHHPNHKYGSLPRNLDLTVKGMALVGTLLGQIFFGLMGDRGGRKRVYGWTLWIMIAASLLNAATAWGHRAAFLAQFCIWRFVLGVGIGGDYPLSAVITSEYSSVRFRGMLIAAVFSMQGIGILAAAVVGIIVLQGFKDSIENCHVNAPCKPLDQAWRIMVAFGAVPALATMYLRSKLPETPRYTLQVDKNTAKAAADVKYISAGEGKPAAAVKQVEAADAEPAFSWRSFARYVASPTNAMVLFGTCSTWFLLDVAFYSQNLLQSDLYSAIGYTHKVGKKSHGHDIFEKVYMNAVATAIVALIGTVPGYWFAVAFVEKMGRKTMQLMGFTMMTITLVILAAAYDQLKNNAKWAFVVLYALMFFFANFGPNTTTFIIPGECFPTRFRSTCHGISAASGKAGAIVGLYAFGTISRKNGYPTALGALAAFMFVGLLCTFLVPETKGKSLEQLERQEANGAADRNGNTANAAPPAAAV
jgi:PHS family inorganic phosphate transporter-like MFS transporter